VDLQKRGITLSHILTDGAIHNAMAVHAAFGASTNLLLHLPAIAFCAGLKRPTVDDWIAVNRKVSRIVDVLPNGPRFFKTVQVFLAGAVPEVMLHLRDLGVVNTDCLTVTGKTVGENLAWWEQSERRRRFREILQEEDGVDPHDVILSPEAARSRGMGRTLSFPTGNLAPHGSVVKSTAIDPSLWNGDIYERTCRARVFVREDDAIEAVKSSGPERIAPGDCIVLLCRGPLGAGMPETAQITIALKYTRALHDVGLITDGRFSGLSSGPCIGHVGPEALAGGPLGKLRDGDWIRIRLDRSALDGRIDLVGDITTPPQLCSDVIGAKLLAERSFRPDLHADPNLPTATKLWAALQNVSGGTWGGCVYDVDQIIERFK
jgi:putative YjhG/YagF family dehydratase